MFIILFYLQWWSLPSLTNVDSIVVINQTRFTPISDNFKQDIYNQCQSFFQKSNLFPTLNYSIHQTISLEDIYLLIYYSPRRDDEGGLYLQMATSYLILQNLQQLSIQQQNRTHIAIFLSEDYTHALYTRLEQWFKSIYTPYTATTHIIRTKTENQYSWQSMINYTKYNEDIQFNTILFFLEDDYIFETDMLLDTIEFFTSHNPCFIYQTDNFDRCRLDMDDGFIHFLVPGRTRLWQSVSSTSLTYACRWKTFLAFEDLIMNIKNDEQTGQKLRARVGGNEVFYCAIPSYSARIETLLLPNEVNITTSDDTAIYYKDWWSMARHALAEAQKLDTFPCPKINEKNLFA